MITDRNILVTGGAGSVGRILVRRLLKQEPNVVRVLDQSEPGLAAFNTEINGDRVRFLAGNVRDKDRLARAVDGIDTVIHTAAMKHIDISEYNPFEAVKTNVMGLQNLIDVSIDADVDRFIFTSSDKAAHPANTMGTTKLLGERLVTAANKYTGSQSIRLASVRFGNVINSSQSVIPVFQEQIKEGGPLTLTDPQMSRFFLTYDDVSELVTGAVKHMEGGEIFIKEMDAIWIEDLAEAMIDVFAPVYGYEPSEIRVTETGRRVGETFDEEIVTKRESARIIKNKSLYAVIPEQANDGGYLTHPGINDFAPVDSVVRSSEDAKKLQKDEIVELLQTEFNKSAEK
jgi:FlaA1/EpsC-like NDP-sugar epimerase